MKLLFMTYDLPYPPESGGKTRAYNLIKALSTDNEVHLLSFIRHTDQLKSVRELEKITSSVQTIERSKVWTPRNLAKTLFSSKALAVSVYESRNMKKALTQVLEKEKFDAVILESFYTSGYLDDVKDTTVILGTENIEYLVYKRYVDNVKFFPIRPGMYLDVLKMKRFEEKTWQKADVILAVSEIDAQVIRNKSSKPVIMVPNGVDMDFFDKVTKEKSSKRSVLFVGSWKYIQNIDAANYLIKEVWPLLGRQIPDLELWLVGRNPPDQLTKLASKNVIFMDNIEDIREVYRKASMTLIPIRAASGTRLKILEAFASKIPVVCTPIAIEGIAAEDGRDYLRAETPEDFCNQAKRIFDDRKLAQEITQNAHYLVKNKYSWSSIVQNFNKYYNTLVNHD